MGYSTKITTCSYCGARAALVLDRGRHELSCDRCGAPLHDMKRLKSDESTRKNEKPVLGHGLHKRPYHAPSYEEYERPKRRKRKRRKSLMHRVMKEVIDVVEDIFD